MLRHNLEFGVFCGVAPSVSDSVRVSVRFIWLHCCVVCCVYALFHSNGYASRLRESGVTALLKDISNRFYGEPELIEVCDATMRSIQNEKAIAMDPVIEDCILQVRERRQRAEEKGMCARVSLLLM